MYEPAGASHLLRVHISTIWQEHPTFRPQRKPGAKVPCRPASSFYWPAGQHDYLRFTHSGRLGWELPDDNTRLWNLPGDSIAAQQPSFRRRRIEPQFQPQTSPLAGRTMILTSQIGALSPANEDLADPMAG